MPDKRSVSSSKNLRYHKNYLDTNNSFSWHRSLRRNHFDCIKCGIFFLLKNFHNKNSNALKFQQELAFPTGIDKCTLLFHFQNASIFLLDSTNHVFLPDTTSSQNPFLHLPMRQPIELCFA